MKRKKMGFIILTSIYLLILLIISTSFAWFFINKEVEVDYGTEITCEAGSSLEISMLEDVSDNGEESWSEFSGYVKYNGPSAKIEDITGDGKTLYRPQSLITDPETNELVPDGLTRASKTNSEGFGEYIELQLKVRSTSTMNIYFSGNSLVKPLNTSDTDRNAYGPFSKHYIAAAIRVAILEVDESTNNEELKMIWAPNPNIELSYNKSTGKYKLENTQNIEKYSYYKLNNETGNIEKYYVTSDEYASKLFIIGSTNTTDSMVNNSPILTSLSPETNELVTKRLVVRVWFEGTDREANQALGGGQVNMNLKFIGMSEKEECDQISKNLVDSINCEYTDEKYVLNNITEDVYYSFNGYTWTKYSSELASSISNYIKLQTNDTKMYFKVLETSTNYEYMNSITIPIEGGATDEV